MALFDKPGKRQRHNQLHLKVPNKVCCRFLSSSWKTGWQSLTNLYNFQKSFSFVLFILKASLKSYGEIKKE